ncbi:MAG: DUF3488 and transglutaminase-like domain-containing protein [Acidimicrobiales bacterium]
MAAELALLAVTLSTTIALSRLFDDNSYFVPVAGSVVCSHLLSMLLRRARLSTPVALMATLLTMLFFVTNVRYGATTTAAVPTGDTWSQIRSDLSEAWDAFAVVKAPTEALDGFVLALMVVMWAAAALADLAAFRVRTVVEALLPSTVVVVFVSLLGVPDNRAATTALFLASVAAFVLLSRIAFPLSSAVPVGPTRVRQPGAQARTGASMIASMVVVGLIVGPLLPGVNAEAVIDWKALDGGGGSRVTLSPLVDARGRLVEQTDVELFRVRTDSATGAYWRTTSLDTYSDGVWGSRYEYTDARGTLSSPDSSQGQILDLEISVSNLGDIWIPAPYEPLTINGVEAKWDPVSSTLVTVPGQFTDGVTYSLTAVVPSFVPGRLRADRTPIPDDIRQRYTGLPVDLSEAVVEFGRELTAPFDNAYDKALALQDYFRNNYEYSTEVAGGHDGNRIERFLFDERIGYCEQFAGTYALLARAAGIPSRVAVGFTPGSRVGDEFVVRGENYHAWPELWIGGAWVQFEPTPGRGSPQGEAWTGVAPDQEGGFDPVQPAAENEIDEGSGLVIPDQDLNDIPEFPDLDTEAGGGGAAVSTGGDGVPGWLLKFLAVMAIGGTMVGAMWWGIPALVGWRRRKRMARARDGRERVEVSWRDLTDSLRQVGYAPRQAETRREYVSRIAPMGVVDSTRLRQVAQLVDASSYGRSEPSDDVAAHARELVAELERELSDRASSGERAKRRLDPRPIFTTR